MGNDELNERPYHFQSKDKTDTKVLELLRFDTYTFNELLNFMFKNLVSDGKVKFIVCHLLDKRYYYPYCKRVKGDRFTYDYDLETQMKTWT